MVNIMYFSNISDTELAQYHNKIENNFSRTLTTITDETEPNLFKVETITEDILKVYPLFYCKEITSSNPNDRILNNKCIICENDEDTRLNFITPSDNTITIDDIGFTSGISIVNNVQLFNTNPLFIFYSKKDRRLLENVKVTANLKSNNNISFYDDGYSNSDGLVYLPKLVNNSNAMTKGTIMIEYNGETKTIWGGS